MKTLLDYTPGKMHKIKIYNDVNVLDAAFQRFELLFTRFDNVCFAVSGGKDSGVAVQLGNMVAERLGKKFSIMFVDLEAMYQATERFVRRSSCSFHYIRALLS